MEGTTEFGTYVAERRRADANEMLYQVTTYFEVTTEIATYLRRVGRGLEGVACGCSQEQTKEDKTSSSFIVRLDKGTRSEVILRLMNALADLASGQLYHEPALAVHGLNRRSLERLLERD